MTGRLFKRQRTWQSRCKSCTPPSHLLLPFVLSYQLSVFFSLNDLSMNTLLTSIVIIIVPLVFSLSSSGGKLSFADFLDVMHTHSKKERIPQELIDAFQGMDPRKTGLISVRDLKHILTDWGERLDEKEVDKLLREINSSQRQSINYHDLVRVICAPVPDY